MDPRLSGNIANSNEPELDCLEVWDQYDDEADGVVENYSKSTTNVSSTANRVDSKSGEESDGLTALTKVVSALRDQSQYKEKADTKVVDQAVTHILQSIQSGLINLNSLNSTSAIPISPVVPATSVTPGVPTTPATSGFPATPATPGFSATPAYSTSKNPAVYNAPPTPAASDVSSYSVPAQSSRTSLNTKTSISGENTLSLNGDHWPPERARGSRGFAGSRGGSRAWKSDEWRGGSNGNRRPRANYRGGGWRDPRTGGGWSGDTGGQYGDNAYNRKRGAPSFGMTHSETKYPRQEEFDTVEETDSYSGNESYRTDYARGRAGYTKPGGRRGGRDGFQAGDQFRPGQTMAWRKRPPYSTAEYLWLKKESAETKANVDTAVDDLRRVRQLRGDLLMMHRDQRDPQVRKCSTIESDIGKRNSDMARQQMTEQRWLADYLRRNPSAETEETPSSESVHVFSDEGDHWCRFCSHTAVDLKELLEHLESEEHETATKDEKPPWRGKEEEKAGEKIDGGPMHGSEFLTRAVGFYCSLCKEFVGGETETARHMAGKAHEDKFQELVAKRPQYPDMLELERYVHTEKKREIIRRDQDRKRMESLVSYHSGGMAASGRIPLKKGSAAAEKRVQAEADIEEERKRRRAKEKEEMKRKEEEIKKKEEEMKRKEEEMKRKEEEINKKEEMMRKKAKNALGDDLDLDSGSEKSPSVVSETRRRRPSRESTEPDVEDTKKRRLSRESSEREFIQQLKKQRSRESSEEPRRAKKNVDTEKESVELKRRRKKRERLRIIESSEDGDDSSSDESATERKKEAATVEEEDDHDSHEAKSEKVTVVEEKEKVGKTNTSVGGESDVDVRNLDFEVVDEVCNDDGLGVVGEELDISSGADEKEEEKEEEEEKRRKEEEEKEKEKEEKRRKEEEEKHRRKEREKQREKARKERERKEEEERKARKEERRKERQRQQMEKERKKNPTLQETMEIFRYLSDGKSKVPSQSVKPKYQLRPCCVRLRRLNLAKYPHLQRQLEEMKRPKERKRAVRSDDSDDGRRKRGRKAGGGKRSRKTPMTVEEIYDSLSSLSSDGEDPTPKRKKNKEPSVRIVKAFSVKEKPRVHVDVGPTSAKIDPTTDCEELRVVSSVDKEEKAATSRTKEENVEIKSEGPETIETPDNASIAESHEEGKEKTTEADEAREKASTEDTVEVSTALKDEGKGEAPEADGAEEKASTEVEVEAVKDEGMTHEETSEKGKEEAPEADGAEEKASTEVEVEALKDEGMTHEEEASEKGKEGAVEADGAEEEPSTGDGVEVSTAVKDKGTTHEECNEENSEAADEGIQASVTREDLPAGAEREKCSPLPSTVSDPVNGCVSTQGGDADLSRANDSEVSPPPRANENLLVLDFSSDIESVDDFVVAAQKVVENMLQKGGDLSSTDTESDASSN